MMIKNKRMLIIISLVLASLTSFLVASEEGAAFSNMPGTRATGLGQSFIGQADDSTSIYLNPAGLSQVEDYTWSFMSYQDMEALFISTEFIYPIGGITLGFGYQGSFMPGFEESFIDDDGNIQATGKTFSYQGSAYYLSMGLGLFSNLIGDDNQFSFGMSAKVIEEFMYRKKAFGFGLDMGVLWESDFNAIPYSLGLSLKNIVPPVMSWNSTGNASDSVPLSYGIGLSSPIIPDTLRMNIDINYSQKTEEQYSLGLEYYPNNSVRVQSGIFEQGWTIGIETRLENAGLGYAMVFPNQKYAHFENQMKFSFNYQWPPLKKLSSSDGSDIKEAAMKEPEYFYQVSVGYFNVKNDAKNLQKVLAAKGVFIKLVPKYQKNKILGYTAVTGEYDSKEEANIHSQFLKTLNIPFTIDRLKVVKN